MSEISISIHSLRVEGDQCCAVAISKRAISIHSLRVEGDYITPEMCDEIANFNPLPPCGGRQRMAPAVRDHALFQSTPSVWRETSNLSVSVALPPISIHSLRVEGDAGCLPRQRRHSHFNPLPPCGGRPVRRQKPPQIRWYFNPLPPCGGRRAASASAMILLTISIHSLRVEGDWTRSARSPTISNFNPLPPCGGRPNFAAVRLAPVYFNPLPPCGGRHREYRARNRDKIFQSTPSVWRETLCSIIDIVRRSISIHSLRVEGDNAPLAQHVPIAISIHSLRVEGDGLMYREVQRAEISIHSLRVEGDNPVR